MEAQEQTTKKQREENVQIESMEMKTMTVPLSLANMSSVLKEMLVEETGEAIPLHTLELNIIQKVFDFCEHYAEDPISVAGIMSTTTDLNVLLKNEWYVRYLDIPVYDLETLSNAADFLDIRPLRSLVALKFGTIFFDDFTTHGALGLERVGPFREETLRAIEENKTIANDYYSK